MFGFIATPCSRCASGSIPVWKGTFCGLSRCLAREFGQTSRFLVNRDAAFVGLLGISIDPKVPEWKQATCCNPLSLPFPVTDEHPAVLHAAATTICGLAAKLNDDACDEGIFRRGLARLGGIITNPATERAVALLNGSSFPTEEVLESLAKQEMIESTAPIRADEPTGNAYGAIVAHLAVLLDTPAQKEPLHRIGSSLGSLVYWRDAWQDRREDTRNKRFNPFLCLDSGEIQNRIHEAWNGFSEGLGELRICRNSALISSVHDTTERTRQSFLHLRSDEDKEKEKRRSKERKRRTSWWDYCDCCQCCDCGSLPTPRRGGCSDAIFDCGPGDRGCCDCNPCDGCDCCPCH